MQHEYDMWPLELRSRFEHRVLVTHNLRSASMLQALHLPPPALFRLVYVSILLLIVCMYTPPF